MQLAHSYIKLSKSSSSSYKIKQAVVGPTHLWATGTKLKIKLIDVKVANNRKAEKLGQV